MGEAKEDETLGPRVRDEQLRLPFDQYQRYRMIADVVELLREDSGSLQILDVGGGEGVILNFLPEDRVTILDRTAAEGRTDFVAGDATGLPFEDGAFDYVTSVDVYEHIEVESRERYLSELRRVARLGVLLAAPFDSEVVRGAERVANEFHRSVHLRENAWLKEHAENGLPRLDGTRRFFEGQGDSVAVLPNGYIPHWLVMMCLTFYSSKLEGELSDLFDHANAFYNEFMYGLDNTEPCYRYLLVSLKEPREIDLGELASSGSELMPRSSALSTTLSVTLPLNIRLTQREGELVRKEAQVNDLARRLAERVAAENARQAQAEQRTSLQRDNDLQKRIDNLERQRDQLQRQLTGLTSTRAWRLLTVFHKLRLGVGRILGSG